MMQSDLSKLGPLAPLAGIWEGEKGEDVAPSDDRGTEHNKFHERMTFEPIIPVQNHEQMLYGLRYATVARRIGETYPFHEEVGYWLWDPVERQVLRCFIIPRGIALIAGGAAEPTSMEFTLVADVGSETYGICSNRFLDREFKTVRFELTVTIFGRDRFHYKEDSLLRMPGKPDLFHHTDQNILRRVSG
ncbi:heme-binding beta-barrel domain-containing protein [Nitrospira japonica]|nr:heme-binding beta-barrel domain-containing protein [Nitrospira japonica]